MFIPGAPIRRPLQWRIFEPKDVLQRPFPFLSGRQAVFSCARMALLYGMRLLDDLPRKVHVPAYCCQSVLAPIEKLGLKVRFYDVGEHLEPIINEDEFSKGDIFLLVHYFGIPQETAHISKLCEKFGMTLVEDCAHALPDPGAKYPMGSLGAFSIFSLRKQLPVLDGGVLVVNDVHAQKQMEGFALPRLRRMLLKTWLLTRFDRLAFTLGWPNTIHIKDVRSKKNEKSDNSDKSIDPFCNSLSDSNMPEIYRITAGVLARADIGIMAGARRQNYYYMAERLLNLDGVTVPFLSLPDGAVPQAFPILVEDVERVRRHMRRKGIGVYRWPGPELSSGISRSDFPGTFSWTGSLLLLPCHNDLRIVHIEGTVKVLREII